MTNKSIENRLNDHYLLGLVKADNDTKYYMAPIAYWILDYPAYDPNILNEKDSDFIFRNNLLVVKPSNKNAFLNAMEEDRIDIKDVVLYNSIHKDEQIQLRFIVDFDNNEFYSSFFDIDIHEYIPENWKGFYRDQLSLK
jgi:hypothetical protein